MLKALRERWLYQLWGRLYPKALTLVGMSLQAASLRCREDKALEKGLTEALPTMSRSTSVYQQGI